MSGRVHQVGNQTRIRIVDSIPAHLVPAILDEWITDEEQVGHRLVSHSVIVVTPGEVFAEAQIQPQVQVVAVFRWKDATQ